MADLSTSLSEAAAGLSEATGEELCGLVREVNGILEAIRTAARLSGGFSRALTYSISSKEAKTESAKLSELNPQECRNIEAFLKRVQAGTTYFWNPNVQKNFTQQQTDSLSRAGISSVLLCFILKEAEIHHRILHRFARVVVYQLSCKGRTADSLAQDLQRAEIYSKTSLDDLVKQIRGFIYAGSRYTHIANRLDGFGSLFFLPQEIPASYWESKLSKSGKKHDAAMLQLRSADIPTKSSPFHELACHLISTATDAATSIAPVPITWLNSPTVRPQRSHGHLGSNTTERISVQKRQMLSPMWKQVTKFSAETTTAGSTPQQGTPDPAEVRGAEEQDSAVHRSEEAERPGGSRKRRAGSVNVLQTPSVLREGYAGGSEVIGGIQRAYCKEALQGFLIPREKRQRTSDTNAAGSTLIRTERPVTMSDTEATNAGSTPSVQGEDAHVGLGTDASTQVNDTAGLGRLETTEAIDADDNPRHDDLEQCGVLERGNTRPIGPGTAAGYHGSHVVLDRRGGGDVMEGTGNPWSEGGTEGCTAIQTSYQPLPLIPALQQSLPIISQPHAESPTNARSAQTVGGTGVLGEVDYGGGAEGDNQLSTIYLATVMGTNEKSLDEMGLSLFPIPYLH